MACDAETGSTGRCRTSHSRLRDAARDAGDGKATRVTTRLGSDTTGCGAVGSAPALGAGSRGFEPRQPDHGTCERGRASPAQRRARPLSHACAARCKHAACDAHATRWLHADGASGVSPSHAIARDVPATQRRRAGNVPARCQRWRGTLRTDTERGEQSPWEPFWMS